MTSYSRPFRLERHSVAFLDFFFFLTILPFVPSWFFLRILGSHVSEESHESSTYFRFILRLALFEYSLLASEEHEEDPKVSLSLALGLLSESPPPRSYLSSDDSSANFLHDHLSEPTRFSLAGTNEKRQIAHVSVSASQTRNPFAQQSRCTQVILQLNKTEQRRAVTFSHRLTGINRETKLFTREKWNWPGAREGKITHQVGFH